MPHTPKDRFANVSDSEWPQSRGVVFSEVNRIADNQHDIFQNANAAIADTQATMREFMAKVEERFNKLDEPISRIDIQLRGDGGNVPGIVARLTLAEKQISELVQLMRQHTIDAEVREREYSRQSDKKRAARIGVWVAVGTAVVEGGIALFAALRGHG